MEYLTVKEVAELKGCSGSYINRLAKSGKLTSITENNTQNGQSCYLFPVSSLPDDLRAKYYGKLKTDSGILPETMDKPAPAKKAKVKRILTFEECSEEQRRAVNTCDS